MHRTTFVPRTLGWSLLVAFVLHACALTAAAQGLTQGPPQGLPPSLPSGPPPQEAAPPSASVLLVPMNTTKQVEMSTKQRIVEVRNENPKVCRVQSLLENPNAVLITGLVAGTSRVTLTDINRKTEILDVTVPSDADVARENARKELLDLLHRAVPTATVDVIAAPNNTVILSGQVGNVENVPTIIEATKSVFPNANVVNGMRVAGVQQVQLEVIVALVNRSESRLFGFSFLETGQHHFVASSLFPGNLNGLIPAPGASALLTPVASLASSPNAVFGIVNDKQAFTGYLQALRTEGLAKLMAEPRVVTLSGRSAEIQSGGSFDIVSSSSVNSTSLHIEFGTIVRFLPIVLGNGKIQLEVNPSVSTPNQALAASFNVAAGNTTFALDKRQVQVTVQMEDGQTLAIGGLIQNRINAAATKVPVLGDLPFLGTAFSTKSYTEAEEELIVLVTPRLVDPLACCQLPKYLPGQETRSPDDFELFLEGILEAPRGQRQVFPDGIHYQAAHKSGGTADMYPCGDSPRPHHLGGRCASGTCGTNGCANGSCGSTYPMVSGNATGYGNANVTSAVTKAAPDGTEMRSAADVVNDQAQAVQAQAVQATPQAMPTGPAPANLVPFNNGVQTRPSYPSSVVPAVLDDPR